VLPAGHRRGAALAAALTLALIGLLAGCESGSGPSADRPPSGPASRTPATSGSPSLPGPSPAPTAADARVLPISAAEWTAMVRTGVWHHGCPQSQATLRRVEVNHYGFDGQVHGGAIVVNADIAPAVARIFTELFRARFPIQQMRPIEAFGGDNEKSMAADNTAAYNCRRATQANSPAPLSPHANGRAIDLNPLHNPWIDPRCHCWSPSKRYAPRRAAPGVVVKGGVAWRIFTAEGWIWQDIGTLDYMHFDTGYPSVPLHGRPSPSPS
jgi:D-alanyl-D-alanine carboxypeptidase